MQQKKAILLVFVAFYAILGIYFVKSVWDKSTTEHQSKIAEETTRTPYVSHESQMTDEARRVFLRPHLPSYAYSFTENGTTHTAQSVHVNRQLLRNFGYRELPIESFEENLNDSNWQNLDFVFVIASSEGHFPESKDAVASIQKFFPNRTILYYDWGLSANQIRELNTLCSVQYKFFDLHNFFPTLKGFQLKTPYLYYAGKVLTIAHALQDHPAILWLDASVRFLSGNIKPILQKARESGGMVFFSRMFHSIYSVTHPSMYRFLPSNTEHLKTTNQMEAIYFIYKSKEIYENIFWWLHLCAMEPECIAPVYELDCAFKNLTADFNQYYRGCHRYDQSAINILAANYYDFNNTKYWVCTGSQGYNILMVKRSVTHMYELQKCR